MNLKEEDRFTTRTQMSEEDAVFHRVIPLLTEIRLSKYPERLSVGWEDCYCWCISLCNWEEGEEEKVQRNCE